MTKEYPPEIYGGAGVHVTELTAQLKSLCEVDIHCMGAPRDTAQVHDPDPALARYTGLKLSIVTPHNDMPFSLHRLGKGFPCRIVEGTGHWIQLDKPGEVNRLLDEFLETVSGER